MLDETKTQRAFPRSPNSSKPKKVNKKKNSKKTPTARIPQKDVKERNRGGKALLIPVAWRKWMILWKRES
jgi:hypothetical protein